MPTPDDEDFIPYIVPNGQRYWVVRAEGGAFIAHFREISSIAVGHLDGLRLRAGPIDTDSAQMQKLYDDLKSKFDREEKTASQFTAISNQIHTFVEFMKPGDMVVTPGYRQLQIGIITGEAYIDPDPISLVIDAFTGAELTMTFSLRRRVIWGPLIKRSDFPVSVTKSLRANQAIFNIDDHWQAIHHLLFPLFERDNNLYISFRIEQQGTIRNFSVAQFLGFLTEIEVFTRLDERTWDAQSFNNAVTALYKTDQLKMSSQAQFMSPGDVWNLISQTTHPEAVVYGLVIYAMLFGNRFLGMDGIIDQNTRQKIAGFIMDRWDARGGEKIKKDLQLTVPTPDTTSIKEAMEKIRSLETRIE